MVKLMPCDCPEDRPTRPVGGCNYLLYSGGSLPAFYRLVEHAIPDVEMAHARPTVHPDGSLEFAASPPAIPGYRQEGPRLYPNLQPCLLRMLRVQVVNGILDIAGICGNPEAGHFSGEVTPEQCQRCPVRQDRT
jgi:hypothetical protein